MCKKGKSLSLSERKFSPKQLVVGMVSLALVHISSASADERAVNINFDSDGTRFNLVNSQRLRTADSADSFWLSGDFDGNGLDDLAQISEDNNNAKVVIHDSDGVNYNTNISQRLNAGFWSGQRWLAGDFNRDGLDDLVLLYSYKGKATAWIYTAFGTGFTRTSTQRLDANFWNEQRWETGDFNGDGRDDLALIYNYRGNATAWIYSATDSGFRRTSTQRLGVPFVNQDRWEIGDFNGDGRDDLLRINAAGGGTAVAWIFTSNGREFVVRTSALLSARFWDAQRWEVGDVDADGMDDVILIYGHRTGGATAWMFRSTGIRLAEPTTQRLGFGFETNQRWIVTDQDGDNYAGLALVFAFSN